MSVKQIKASERIVAKIDNMSQVELIDYIGNLSELIKKFDLYRKHAQGLIFARAEKSGLVQSGKETDCKLTGKEFTLSIKVSPLYEAKRLIDLSAGAQKILLPAATISWSSIRSNKDITSASDKSFKVKSYSKKFSPKRL